MKFSDITNGDTSLTIRNKICDYLLTNPILFDEIDAKTVIEWESNTDLNSYVNRMRSTSTWGGATEIKCFCEIYKCDVEVFNIRNHGNITLLTKSISFQTSQQQENTKIARVSWNGGHYEPL